MGEAHFFSTCYKTPAALTISTEHIKFPRLYSLSCCYLFDVFSKCACSPHAVKNSIISKKHQKCKCAWNPCKTNGFAWFGCAGRFCFCLASSTSLLLMDDIRWTSLVSRGRFNFSWCIFSRSCGRWNRDFLNQRLDTLIVYFLLGVQRSV